MRIVILWIALIFIALVLAVLTIWFIAMAVCRWMFLKNLKYGKNKLQYKDRKLETGKAKEHSQEYQSKLLRAVKS